MSKVSGLTSTRTGFGLTLILLIMLMLTAWGVAGQGLGASASARVAQAQPAQTQAQRAAGAGAGAGAVLTVVLRGNIGQPLSGVLCEVLSYDWGVPMGKAYATIAQGETDPHGVVAFDMSPWPHSGYLFKFSQTDHTLPADTYFLPESQNQYRGFPAAVVGGTDSSAQTHYFVLTLDGLVYNDLTGGQGVPVVEKNPVGGMTRPRVSPQDMSSQNFLATARAATATAYAQGIPTLTPPPPPATFGGIGAALVITPQAQALAQTATAGTTPTSPGTGVTTSAKATSREATGGLIGPAPTLANPGGAGTGTGTAATATAGSPVERPSSDLLTSTLLALFGLVSLFLFWKNRQRVYGWLGVDTAILPLAGRGDNKSKKSTKARKSARAAQGKGGLVTRSFATARAKAMTSGQAQAQAEKAATATATATATARRKQTQTQASTRTSTQPDATTPPNED